MDPSITDSVSLSITIRKALIVHRDQAIIIACMIEDMDENSQKF